jgi:hypothetical protein
LRIIGIDPGNNGAIASLAGDKVEVDIMPVTIREVSVLLAEYFGPSGDGHHVFIEKAQSFPKQGIASAFNYGVHFGELLGVLAAYSIPHTLVPPKTWTRVMHAGTKDGEAKARSLEACQRLFPKVSLLATPRCKRAHDGLVDALLLAEYGRRSLGFNEYKERTA